HLAPHPSPTRRSSDLSPESHSCPAQTVRQALRALHGGYPPAARLPSARGFCIRYIRLLVAAIPPLPESGGGPPGKAPRPAATGRSEEHTSELQSRENL